MPARESTRVNEASKLLRARSLAKSCKILHGTSHRCPMRGRYRGERGGRGSSYTHVRLIACALGLARQEMKSKANQTKTEAS